MELINIKPCNNTFFGDGHQFNFGISNFIRSKNTPFPSVFFGAIFTAILSKNDDFRYEFINRNKYDHERILKLYQVYLYNEDTKEVFIPAPKDLFVNSNGKKEFGTFKVIDSELYSLSFKRILRCPMDRDFKRVGNEYININNIYDAYAKKQEVRIKLKDESDIFVKNNKIGIGVNKDTKSVEESKLYKIEQTEFIGSGWSYVVEYEVDKDYLNKEYKEIDVKCLDFGYLKLGGEGKVCKYKRITNSSIEKFNKDRHKMLYGNIFKILFTSDTYFYESIDKVFSGEIKIIGMSNDKPIYIGGFDMQRSKGQQRKMYKGYPAGTVIIVEVINDSLETRDLIKNKMNNFNSKGFNQYVVIEGGC